MASSFFPPGFWGTGSIHLQSTRSVHSKSPGYRLHLRPKSGYREMALGLFPPILPDSPRSGSSHIKGCKKSAPRGGHLLLFFVVFLGARRAKRSQKERTVAICAPSLLWMQAIPRPHLPARGQGFRVPHMHISRGRLGGCFFAGSMC